MRMSEIRAPWAHSGGLLMLELRSRFLTVASSAAIAAVFCSAAFAQQEPAPKPPEAQPAPAAAPADAAPAAAADGSEEVVVTARRREEVLQRIPVSVSAFGRNAIRNKQLENIADIARFTPGFQFNAAFGSTLNRPVIRGASNILLAEGKVGVFIDGVPLIGDYGQIDLANNERVEVIRGPQAALFGRGTLSGAINYVPLKPSNEMEGGAQATVGNFGRYDAMGWVSGPIVEDVLYFYASGKYYRYGGDFTNFVDGSKLNEVSSYSANLALRFTPTDKISMGVRYIYSNDDESHYAIYLQNSTSNNCFLNTRPTFCGTVAAPTNIGLNTNRLIRPGVDREAQRFLFDASMEWEGWNFVYQGGYTMLSRLNGVDQTYNETAWYLFSNTQNPPAAGPFNCFTTQNSDCTRSPFETTDGQRRKAWTHELRLESPVDNDIRVRIGAFFFRDTREDDGRGIERQSTGPRSLGATVRNRNTAIFAAVDWDISEEVKLTFEGRFAREVVDNIPRAYRAGDVFAAGVVGSGPYNPNQCVGGTLIAAVCTPGAPRQAVYNNFTPRGTLTYQFSDNIMFYANAGVGTSPGGFNNADAPQPQFDEERLTSYEAGVKTSWDERTVFNVALFHNIYKGQVLTNTYITGAGQIQSFSANIGKSRFNGIEIEAQRRFFDRLTVNATYSYIDAKITEGTDRDLAVLRTGTTLPVGVPARYRCEDMTRTFPAGTLLPDGTLLAVETSCATLGSIVGRVPPLVSKHLFSAGFDYRLPLTGVDGEFFFGANVTYRSAFYAQTDNLQQAGASTKVDAQMGFENDTYRVSLWVKNAFDEDSVEGILRYIDQLTAPVPNSIGQPRGFGVTPTQPRTFGLTASLRF